MASTPKNKFVLGISLIETIVAIGIAIFIFFIISSIFLAHNKIFNIQTISANNEINNYLALNKIEKITRSANRVLASKIINSVNYNTSNNTLVLELSSIDDNEDIIPDTFDYASFHLDNQDQTKLILSLEANALSSRYSGENLVSSSVDKIIFSYNDNDPEKIDLVSVYLSNSRTTLGTTEKTITSTSFGLRNSL